ncbi:MAG: hypothetical protein M1527_04585 [Gammaproteobacteria bacterium]|nr:hypothetical protein [Gammaproteobacteria bacterium]
MKTGTMVFCSLALLLVTTDPGAVLSAERMLVVVTVTGAETKAASLTQQEVRRLFLGETLIKDGEQLIPLLNTGDPMLYEVFLQKVIFLSARNYERQVLSRVFRMGGRRPAAYTDSAKLLEALRSEPGRVSYMWDDMAKSSPGIKTVGTLWQSPAD